METERHVGSDGKLFSSDTVRRVTFSPREFTVLRKNKQIHTRRDSLNSKYPKTSAGETKRTNLDIKMKKMTRFWKEKYERKKKNEEQLELGKKKLRGTNLVKCREEEEDQLVREETGEEEEKWRTAGAGERQKG